MTAIGLALPRPGAHVRRAHRPTLGQRAVGVLASLVLVVAAGGFLALAVGPHLLGYRTAVMLTGSMTGTIDPGDLVVSAAKPAADVEVGDVITFRAPVPDQHVETHRVIAVKHRTDGAVVVRTQGDANEAPDPWRATIAGDTVWETQRVVPVVGDIIRTMRSPVIRYGAAWISLGATVLLGLSLIWQPKKE